MARINSRQKGASAEREAAQVIFDMTGVKMRRNLDQVRDGGHDLLVDMAESVALSEVQTFFSGTAFEIKRYKTATHAVINGWWNQTTKQAARGDQLPVLMYRLDNQKWKFVVPIWFMIYPDMTGRSYRTQSNNGLDYTATLSIEGFESLLRHKLGTFFNHELISCNTYDTIEELKPVSHSRRSKRRIVMND